MSKYNLINLFAMFFLISVTYADSTYTKNWGIQYGSIAIDSSKSVQYDSNNNLILIGNTRGSLFKRNLNPGTNDIYVVKLTNDTGTEIWKKQIGSSGSEEAYSLKVDKFDNIYIAGLTTTDYFGESFGQNDGFILKLDSNGNEIWKKTIGTENYDYVKSIDVDDNEFIYVTGYTEGSLYGENFGASDMFFASFDTKLESSNDPIFFDQVGSPVSEFGTSIVYSSTKICILGNTIGSLYREREEPEYYSYDYFLTCYNENLEKKIEKQYGIDNKIEYSESMSINESTGNLFIIGITDDSKYGENQGGYDIFIVKLDSNGEEIKGTQMGTPDNSTGFNDGAGDIILDRNENVYFTGEVGGELYGKYLGYTDIIFGKMDSNLNLIWSAQTGTTNVENSFGILLDSTGTKLYLAGNTSGNFYSKAKGFYDGFIGSYSLD